MSLKEDAQQIIAAYEDGEEVSTEKAFRQAYTQAKHVKNLLEFIEELAEMDSSWGNHAKEFLEDYAN